MTPTVDQATDAAPDASRVDGRSARSARSRRIVVEAFLDLVLEGEPQPTAQLVSERCGISMRTIFRIFADVEALHVAAVAAQFDRVRDLYDPPVVDGPLAARVDALVERRCELYDSIAPVRRLAIRLAPTSTPIREGLTASDAQLRARMEAYLQVDLAALPAARRRQAVDTVDAATSWEFWDRLHRGQGLGRTRVAEVMSGVVTAALAP